MPKKPYALALVSLLLIPAVTVLGGLLFSSINPEIAAGHANYEQNYRLIDAAQKLAALLTLLVNIGLWFLTCFFLVKSKKRSYAWSTLAIFGPFGLIVLTMLRDNEPGYQD